MHFIQRLCYQRGILPRSSRQSDHTKTWPSWRDANCSGMVMSPVHHVWPNRLERHSEWGKKTRQTEAEVGKQHQGMDRPGVRQVPEGSGEQGKWRKLVVKSSVMPQRPSRLRDRWWWWWTWKLRRMWNGKFRSITLLNRRKVLFCWVLCIRQVCYMLD